MQRSSSSRRPSSGNGLGKPAVAERQRNAKFFDAARQGNDSQQAGLQAALKRAAGSGQLNLADRGLVVLPEEVCNFADITIEGCNWWEQCPITKLDVSNNKLQELPADIQKLVDMSVILAGGNRLEQLPDSIGELPLKALHVSSNALSHIPHGLSACRSLVELMLRDNQLCALPEDMSQLVNLEVLDVSMNKLSRLPTLPPRLLRFKASENSLIALGDLILPRLQELDLAKNKLNKISQNGFCKATSLVSIKLDENALTELPDFRTNSSLDSLSVGFNRLVSLPSSLPACKRLSALVAHNNVLTSLPEGMAQLHMLGTLDVSNNELSQLPLELGRLQSLKRLCVQGNPLRSLPPAALRGGTEALKKCLRERLPEDKRAIVAAEQEDGISVALRDANASRQLLLHGQGIGRLPDDFELPEGLETLNLKQNSLKELTVDLQSVSRSLLELHLDGNKLQDLPSAVGTLSSLRHLGLSKNGLRGLPAGCCLWARLQFVDMSSNQLDCIPEVLALRCPALVEMRLSFNKITSMHPYGCQGAVSPSLCTIDLESNRLSSVPSSLQQSLPALTTLMIANNNIVGLPPSFGSWDRLRAVTLHGNPWKEIRTGLVQKGWPAVRDFLSTRVQAEARGSSSPQPLDQPGVTNSASSSPSAASVPTGAISTPQTAAVHPRMQQVEVLKQEVQEMQDRLQNPTGMSSAQVFALRKLMQKKNAERIRLEREAKAEMAGASAAQGQF